MSEAVTEVLLLSSLLLLLLLMLLSLLLLLLLISDALSSLIDFTREGVALSPDSHGLKVPVPDIICAATEVVVPYPGGTRRDVVGLTQVVAQLFSLEDTPES